MTHTTKGYTIPLAIAFMGVIGSIGGAWVSATSAASSQLYETKLAQKDIDSVQNSDIRAVKSSVCIQNQNILAIGKALKVNVTDDPNCK